MKLVTYMFHHQLHRCIAWYEVEVSCLDRFDRKYKVVATSNPKDIVQRKCFLCYPAHDIPSFGASVSSAIRRTIFLRSAQVFPSFGASASSAIRRKRFLRSAQALPLFGASASFVRCKCFLRSAQVLPSFGAKVAKAPCVVRCAV